MALQKVVNIDPAIGVPGSQAAFLGEVITVQNYLSDGTAAAGQFVWNGTATVNPVSGGAIGVACGQRPLLSCRDAVDWSEPPVGLWTESQSSKSECGRFSKVP